MKIPFSRAVQLPVWENLEFYKHVGANGCCTHLRKIILAVCIGKIFFSGGSVLIFYEVYATLKNEFMNEKIRRLGVALPSGCFNLHSYMWA